MVKQYILPMQIPITHVHWWKGAIDSHPMNDIMNPNPMSPSPSSYKQYCQTCVIAQAIDDWLSSVRPSIWSEQFGDIVFVEEVMTFYATLSIVRDNKAEPFVSIIFNNNIRDIIASFDDRYRGLPDYIEYEASALTGPPPIPPHGTYLIAQLPFQL